MSTAATYARLREHTLGSHEDEEAVTVNTRALIDKVLARYSGEWTTLRELLQNAADAHAKHVSIRFETLPSTNVPIPPPSSSSSQRLQHVLQHHTLKTLLVTNDGELFKENDWARLKRIAEGNPDETKIGAFGVGFYSVFADCETPFVCSGTQSMAFYWKKDSLFTRRGTLPTVEQPSGAADGTTFMLDYRSQSSPVPPLLGLCQFLATSLTFVGLETVDLWLDEWRISTLRKKMSPGASVSIPKDISPRTRDGLMKIVDVEYQIAQIDARWMNVVAWDRRPVMHTITPPSQLQLQAQQQQLSPNEAGAGSLRSWFSRFTSSTGASPSNAASRRAQREEEVLQQAVVDDLAGESSATVFLRLSTVNVQTYVSKQLAAELERATKKPPPKNTRIAILTSYAEGDDHASSSLSSTNTSNATGVNSVTSTGATASKAPIIFSSVLPTAHTGGRIFIGFSTAQTTGLRAHISAPAVIPTVERESIDLNARWVRDWNTELLRVAGIACRIAYAGEMGELKSQLDRRLASAGARKVSKEDFDAVLPAAAHAYAQFGFEESTPSAKVGQCVEEAFWTCGTSHASIDVLSTGGVLPSQRVRVATEDLSFVDGIPVVPEVLMGDARAGAFVGKLREYGLLSDITTADIKKELEAQALTESQVTELVRWACKKVSQSELTLQEVRELFEGTVGSIGEAFVATSLSPVLQLGGIKAFVNVTKIPAELPTPPDAIPFRFTKGLPLKQLEALGWEELQIVPWLRWLVESNGQGFGAAGENLTNSPAVAAQVLPVLSKAWDALSPSSKQTVVELLAPRTVIPTKLGMRKPEQAYFASVRLFDDLPTIVGLQSVKEKMLAALGVRKTVELGVVFERLMAGKSDAGSGGGGSAAGKWSHVDLIRYLVSVRDDIPADDLKKLRETPICPAETRPADQSDKGKLHRLSELFEPSSSSDDALRRLGLPILAWPSTPPYRAQSPEGRFLRQLGLQAHPSVPDLVEILAKAPAQSEFQQHALNYWIVNYYAHSYNAFPIATIDKAFLPVQPFAGEGQNLIAKPTQCYANPQAAVLRFRTLRQDLQPHAQLFGVAQDPPIDIAAERLIKAPPADAQSAKVLFGYFAGRLAEIGPQGNLAEKVGEANVVPIALSANSSNEKRGAGVRLVSPRSCFLGDSGAYGDIFDFVDFGLEANSFLLRVGAKHEPSAMELAGMLVRQPGKLLETLGAEKYLQLLRKVAESTAGLKKDRVLWGKLKSVACLLAVKEVVKPADEGALPLLKDADDDESFIKEYSLAPASGMVIVDDFATYRLFAAQLRTAPQEEVLEDLYAALETPWLSRLVEDDQRMGALLRDQSGAAKLRALIVERCRLFLHDHAADVVRHDARWMETNLMVKATEFLQITRRLKGYTMQFVEKRTAALHRESKREATLFVTARFDLYEVSRAIMGLLLKRPRQQDFLALETILESDLRRLKTKGYNVDRILRLKAAESRVAAEEMGRREQELKRLAETEAARRPKKTAVAPPLSLPDGRKPDTPDRALSIPGAFAESPEQHVPSSTERGGPVKKGILKNIGEQLGLTNTGFQGTAQQQTQNLLTNGHNKNAATTTSAAGDNQLPPPYTPREPRGPSSFPGEEQVTSPRALQQNLQSAIAASRSFNSASVFSTPETNEIKETPSYCDSRPGQDLQFITTLSHGIKLFLSRSHRDPTGFLHQHIAALALFASLLRECASIFALAPETLNIFHDDTGSAIAFNLNGALFCNLRYFMQLHMAGVETVEGRVQAMAYWWVTLCHELAHNVVSDHSARHSFYTESFVAQYFGRMVWWVGRQQSGSQRGGGDDVS